MDCGARARSPERRPEPQAAGRWVPRTPFATAHRAPRTLYIRPHVERDVSRHLRRSPHRGAQRLRDVAGARGRDALVRVRRGHAAPDDALRGELCVVRDLLHALSRRPFSRSDRTDPYARAADARRAYGTVWP